MEKRLSFFYGGNGGRKAKPVTEVELDSRPSCCFAALTTGPQHRGIPKLAPVKNNLCFGSSIMCLYFFMGFITITMLSVLDLLCSRKALGYLEVPDKCPKSLLLD